MNLRLAVLPLSMMSTLAFAQPIPTAKDSAFPGTMTLQVDATDTDRAIFDVRQTIPVPSSGPMVLLFPEWIPGTHAARGEIEKLAGLVIKANGKTIDWRRDATNVYDFHLTVPSGVRQLDVSFKFLAATERDQGRVQAGR